MVTARRRLPAAPLALALVAVLVCALAGGLLRAGAGLGAIAAMPGAGQVVAQHAALMIGAFMGALIAIERCVALKWRAGWAAPVACVAAGVALFSGHMTAGAALLAGASSLFVAMNVMIVARQAVPHTWLLLAGACCWLAGNVVFLAGGPAAATHAWWFAFLVMTISAERLEMARLMRTRRGSRASLVVVLALLALGAGASAFAPAAGGVLFGASLASLAGWLLRNDIARRTVRADGLPRYMAVCLLGGYGWLAIAGVAWAGWSMGWPLRDAALHALGLGFVFSMMMGHAPVILPAVAGIKVRFGPWFYVPLAALHASLLLRLAGPLFVPGAQSTGSLLNAAAIGLFVLTLAGSAIARPR